MDNEQNKETQEDFNKENNSAAEAAGANQDEKTISSEAQNKIDSVKDKVEAAEDTAKGFYDQAKDTAGHAYGLATKRATEVLDEKKEVLTGGLTSVADSIKQFGENLNSAEEKNPIAETAAKYTNGLAEQIEKVSDYFEGRDIREMVGDVETFARKYPAYFIGGAFALGFLAARFLKSSQPKQLSKAAGQSFGSAKNAVNPS